jgi:hypothetical protein
MPRGHPRKNPQAAPVAAPAPKAVEPAQLALPRPIVVDVTRLEIPDLSLMLRMQAVDQSDEAAVQALVFQAIPMIERLVVGGLAGFKVQEHLPAVIVEVFRQISGAGNPGN